MHSCVLLGNSKLTVNSFLISYRYRWYPAWELKGEDIYSKGCISERVEYIKTLATATMCELEALSLLHSCKRNLSGLAI